VRVAVTGAGGGLGRAFLERGAGGHEVIPFTHRELPVEDAGAVDQEIVSARPDVVLHLAALTSVDRCEQDPDTALAVNVRGTANVARATKRSGATLVLLSTDYVFDGEKDEPYDERDEPNPLSVYGTSKLRAEEAARDVLPEEQLVVIRTSWVFGAEGEFVRRSVARLADGEEIGGIVDQIGTPTYVRHLAERLLPVVDSGGRGVVHLAGPEPTSWFDVLSRARDLGGLPGSVAEQKADELGRPAPRPRNSALRSVTLPGTAVPPMPPLDEALRELVEEVAGGRG
jgi:dTDP-4-dehydrorhamnose reductase